MTIDQFVQDRGITEVLHFTTNSGLTGMIAQQSISSRNLLKEETYLEHIYKQSCPDRSRDTAHHGYVNLSISRINSRLFGIAEGNWHRGIDGWWCILSISTEILSHKEVIFTTTNNIYPSIVREEGVAGIQRMFAPTVLGRYAEKLNRVPDMPPHYTTCPQAEVLYPGLVPFSYVRRIYFRDHDHADAANAIFSACSLQAVPCIVDPNRFR